MELKFTGTWDEVAQQVEEFAARLANAPADGIKRSVSRVLESLEPVEQKAESITVVGHGSMTQVEMPPKKRGRPAKAEAPAAPVVAVVTVTEESPAVEVPAADLKARLITFANKTSFDEATALIGKAQDGAKKFRDIHPDNLPALDLLLQEAGL
jgi:hypothetical protein